MANRHLIYPYTLTYEDDIYYVDFIDFDNVFTDGDTLEEAMISAKEVLEGVVLTMLKHNKILPKPSFSVDGLADNQSLAFVDVWALPLLEQAEQQSIKKTLTIPKWLNDASEKEGVNFSNILQTALKKELGIIK